MVIDYQALLCEGTEALLHCTDTPRLDAEVLLSYIIKKERVWFVIHAKEQPDAAECAAFRALIARRAAGEPVAYLTGEREFMGLPFAVRPGVLIPRPDTETLVEAVLQEQLPDAPKILDLCTGSGAIAVSLAHFLPRAHVCAIDISDVCVETAQKNAVQNGVSGRMRIIRADILSGGFSIPADAFSAGEDSAQSGFAARDSASCPSPSPAAGDISGSAPPADVLVSNPPYIPSMDIAGLMPDVRDYEPLSALDGGGDGLLFYRRIAELLPALLAPGRFVALEVGHDQADEVAALLTACGCANVRFARDLAGIRRVVLARRSTANAGRH